MRRLQKIFTGHNSWYCTDAIKLFEREKEQKNRQNVQQNRIKKEP